MKREIKFRAWDKEEKKMFPSMSIEEMLDLSDIEVTKNIGLSIGFIYALKHENIELLQFTGLLDKNGKEIFEGDILKSGDNYNSVVTWGDWNEGPCFYLDEPGYEYGSRKHTMFAYTTPFEVIGNIYENPELLNPKDK